MNIERKDTMAMETGTRAWLATQPPGSTRIDLPGGWYWDIISGNTGYLKTPQNQACVQYDIRAQSIRFGASGLTAAPGINLWVAQEMGEKFARENFMDADTSKAYDEFAQIRGEERHNYERVMRDKIKGVITMELKEGKWAAHVSTQAVYELSGLESEEFISREEGVALFNRMSEAMHVMPLRNPMGYMVLDENVYMYIKDQYDFQYNDTIDNIDAGFINGSGYGCERILENLDATVRKNIREYCLPDGVNYQDLRFVTPTPEIESAVNEFVKQRVTKTVDYEKRRDHTKESLARDHERFLAAAETLQGTIGEVALAPWNMPQLEPDGDLKM